MPEKMDEGDSFLRELEKEQHPDMSYTRRNTTISSWIRLGGEIVMGLIILALLLRPLPSSNNTRYSIRTPMPDLPKRTHVFLGNETLLNKAMFESREKTLHTLHQWIGLSSDARGYVHIPDWKNYDLGEPLDIKINMTSNGPGYMISAFHQLHCLSYLVANFQAGYGGANLTEEVAHHSAHCFDNIRQAIMCGADTTLEGKTEAGPGWGSTHECTDWEALLIWSNEHSALKWRNLMPGEAIL